MKNITEQIASKFLGKKVDTISEYDPSLIVAIPRYENRKQYKIDENNLPFAGCDIWHAYEFSALTENGLPVTRLMKMKYSCDSKYLVESKSLKLYLNSFNMSRFGKNISECLDICKKIIEKDLSKALQTNVTINFLDNNTKRTEIFNDFENILDFADVKKIEIEHFKETPKILETEKLQKKKSYKLFFDSLRSNCRVTHQPDFGDVYIYYKSNNHIKEESLIKYLCSFRCEYHFHEECCEMVYKRLYDLLNKGDSLFVCILYTRRGGIDISPVRYSSEKCKKYAEKLVDIHLLARKNIKQ